MALWPICRRRPITADPRKPLAPVTRTLLMVFPFQPAGDGQTR
jgi:hypothetical protein